MAWIHGDGVIWRSCHGDHVGCVFPARVVADVEDLVLYQPHGAVCKLRSGERGGPRGRNMMPGGWDGRHVDRIWDGPNVVHVSVPPAGFRVSRTWDPEARRFHGWFINLEEPWRRTPMGVDSRDLVLDIVVDEDLATWHWKDADEFYWARDAGLVDGMAARLALEQANAAIRALESRAWPFNADWNAWRPDPGWTAPPLPEGWDRLER
jgi:hypothetical protein